jgi:guanylate kinase
MMKIQGTPIIISGPSGVGKGTVIKKLLKKPNQSLVLSVSMTTRSPRPGEIEGTHYFFTNRENFLDAINNNEMAEWANVYDRFYGTKRSYLEDNFQQGLDVILDIDIQGAASMRMLYPKGIFIYLLPPSLDELKQRLFSRESGNCDNVEKRGELALQEIRLAEIFDYWVVNDRLDDTVENIRTIINAHRFRVGRQKPLITSMNLLP